MNWKMKILIGNLSAPVDPVHYPSRSKEATVASITLQWLWWLYGDGDDGDDNDDDVHLWFEMMMMMMMICDDDDDDDDKRSGSGMFSQASHTASHHGQYLFVLDT